MAAEQSLLEGRTAARSPIGFLLGKQNSGIRVTRYLQDGDSFQRGNVMVTSYLVPGHTDGSAAYLAGGTLYLGDSADSGKDGNVLPAKRLLSNDIEQNRASLTKLAEKLKPQASEIEFMEFAHSGPCRELHRFSISPITRPQDLRRNDVSPRKLILYRDARYQAEPVQGPNQRGEISLTPRNRGREVSSKVACALISANAGSGRELSRSGSNQKTERGHFEKSVIDT